MALWGIPGLAVGIVDHGETAYARGFGVQSLDTHVPVTVDSTFCIQSISKCFVATAVMQMVERRKIWLDAPVVQYLPYFRLDDDRFRQITVHQMLSHTSGLPDMSEVEYNELISHPEYDDLAAERYVRSLSSRKMIAAPGEHFRYSNIGYCILGDLIGKVSGQIFEEYMRDNILRPAGMQDSTFLIAEVDRQRLAMPHLRSPEMIVNPIYPYHRGDAPASFLHSSVVDMCHWIICCLNQGVFDGHRLLNPSSFDLMWTPVVQRRSSSAFYRYGGIGWTVGEFEGLRTISHGGGGFGWTGFLAMLPEKQCGFIFLCNEESTARERIIEAVTRAMLDQEPRAGTVSWMVPINHALEEGGIQAAYARYAELQESGGQEYHFDEYDLVSLMYQLVGAGKVELAIEVLNLNLRAFPDDVNSYLYLAKIYLQKGQLARARESLEKALAVQPANTEATEMLKSFTPSGA
jgi:CubicO group peptidase (beta-lactamase class C family)